MLGKKNWNIRFLQFGNLPIDTFFIHSLCYFININYLCSKVKVKMTEHDSIKSVLLDQLKQESCFWSYNEDSIRSISDDMLIEKTLLYLDLPEIDLLFKLYPFKQIKQVWLEYLIPQEEYLYTLNRFFAWYYFKAKRPDTYIKSMATRHYNRMLQ